MRSVVAAVAITAAVVGSISMAALAAPAKNGLPSYTDGYERWTKLNRRPITKPGAHNGIKNVYASKRRTANGSFPNGTVIVKSIAEPGKRGLAAQIAVMRKLNGRWRWVEYELDGSRYGVLAQGALCVNCHMQARANDWVFTRR